MVNLSKKKEINIVYKPDHGRERKILVYKKKRRKGYQRKNGHRQWYTNIEIQNIQMSKIKSAPKPKKNKKES